MGRGGAAAPAAAVAVAVVGVTGKLLQLGSRLCIRNAASKGQSLDQTQC